MGKNYRNGVKGLFRVVSEEADAVLAAALEDGAAGACSSCFECEIQFMQPPEVLDIYDNLWLSDCSLNAPEKQ
eukprot:587220-Amphidinium_carterae.1